jgi:plastocyanin
MSAIDIKKVNGRVVFEPATLSVAENELVFWRNWDPDDQHWITMKDQRNDLWFAFPLAPFVDGQPPDTTRALIVQGPNNIVYECSLHKEQGTIEFVPLGAPLIA